MLLPPSCYPPGRNEVIKMHHVLVFLAVAFLVLPASACKNGSSRGGGSDDATVEDAGWDSGPVADAVDALDLPQAADADTGIDLVGDVVEVVDATWDILEVTADLDGQTSDDAGSTESDVASDVAQIPDTILDADVCTPRCSTAECGDDGCGGTCGTCIDGKACRAGTCLCTEEDHKACCGDGVCWFDSCGAQGAKTADCQYGCADATASCIDCVGDCTGKNCGDDGCGHECGTCPKGACDALIFVPGQACLAGNCTGDRTPAVCSDANPCTQDQCDAILGCAFTAVIDGSVCVPATCAGNVWAMALTCVTGQCSGGGGSQTCVDGNPCTDDDCVATLGCVFPKNALACDDGDPCTTGDKCQSGICSGAGTLDCDDGVSCTVDGCASPTGCSHELIGGRCLIDGACHGDGEATGKCLECEPSVATGAWTYMPTKTCDDGVACTKNDQCIVGGSGDAGCLGTPYSCDDHLDCTDDICDGQGGCAHPVQPGWCLIEGTCVAVGATLGQCQECDPASSTTAWSYKAGKACDDGDACTKADRCTDGGSGDIDCHGTAFSCDDGRACTDDICLGDGTCSHPVQTGSCLIAGTCRAAGDADATHFCQSCRPDQNQTAWSFLDDGTSCGAGTCDGLTFMAAKSCLSGQCTAGGAVQSCDDGKACTDDACTAAGCTHTVAAGWCQIGGECFADGAVRSDNACQVCAVSMDPSVWSPSSDGTQCATGSCSGLNWTAPRTCESGQCSGGGSIQTCDDGRDCTVDACDASAGCSHLLQVGTCLIGGTCRADLVPDPANPCQACLSDVSQTVWSPVANGTVCESGACGGLTWTRPRTCTDGVCLARGTVSCNDGVPCTSDACDSEAGCSHSILAGDCLIAGVCHAEGDASGQCLQCKTATSQNTWTYVVGRPCDDGAACTKQDQCILGGTDDAGCHGSSYSCDDGLGCTTDSCDGQGGCMHPIVDGWCHISGECWGSAQANPLNICQVCTTTTSTTAWSSGADGIECRASDCTNLNWTSAHTCASGQCTGGGAVESCDDGKACTTDLCAAATGCSSTLQGGSCLINGACYGDGQPNPGNPCQACIISEATSSWSNVTDGNVCLGSSCAGLMWTSAGTCATGQCQAGANQNCNDGKACTTDACVAATGCSSTLVAGNCLIAGTCHAEGVLNTGNACEACTTSKSTSTWSALANGTECLASSCIGLGWNAPWTCSAGQCASGGMLACNDGKACTTDACNPATGCWNTLLDGYCLIGGGCYGEAQLNPGNACQNCATAGSTSAWSSLADGEQCLASSCAGLDWTAPRTCASGQCTVAGAVSSCDDAKACTTDSCMAAGGCSSTLQAGNCLIDGTCHAEGAANGADTCKVCTTASSSSAWSNATDGASCGTGGGCVQGTCCNANDHKACSGGNVHWYDSCGNVGSLAEACAYRCSAGLCYASNPCPTGYELAPSGTFTMGSPTGEPGRGSTETQHEVTISNPFCIKATEVTQGEWLAVMGNNPSWFNSCGSTCPVEWVSWWDSAAYCNALSAKESMQQCYSLTGCTGTPGARNYTCTGATFAGQNCPGYRLPTEAEWEYAARAGTTTGTYNGTGTLTGCEEPNLMLDPIAWFCGNSKATFAGAYDCSAWSPQGTCGTQVVKGKQANPWGLYDMLGNVWEWVWDWNGPYPTGTTIDPTGAATGSNRATRGGSWGFNGGYAGAARAAFRGQDVPGDLSGALGFRPLRSTCGGIACPTVSGYIATCNTQQHCEYSNVDTTGWKEWDIWIYVPGSSFTMGSPLSEAGHMVREEPAHSVTFDKGYLVAKYEMTVAQYEACRSGSPGTCTAPSTVDWDGLSWGTNGSANGRAAHPQNGLTWDQAGAGCAWLGGRLPSEAEWEYAATGPAHRKYPWGDTPEPICANVTAVFDEDGSGTRPWACNSCTNSGCSGTSPVGLKPSGVSWCGAGDMAGNVWEWCQDSFFQDYTGAPTDGSAWVSQAPTDMARRGGSFAYPANMQRSSYRGHYAPTARSAEIGARCVRDLPITCGDIACQTMGGYKVSCNAQSHCEYANADTSGWKAHDVWILIPPGAFTMGSPAGEDGRTGSEDPTHVVTFSNGYLVAKYETTVAQYEACEATSPGTCTAPSTADWDGAGWGTNRSVTGRKYHPQNGLTWDQAGAVCSWLGGRRPSEAEWEYAATGPTHRKYPWGDTPEPTCANNTAVFNEAGGTAGYGCGTGGTMPVGSKTAGASWSGALDVAGNLWEWGEDWFKSTYTGAPTDGSAWVSPSGTLRILRGGGFFWFGAVWDMRSSHRDWAAPNYRSASYGARCVRNLPGAWRTLLSEDFNDGVADGWQLLGGCAGMGCPTVTNQQYFMKADWNDISSPAVSAPSASRDAFQFKLIRQTGFGNFTYAIGRVAYLNFQHTAGLGGAVINLVATSKSAATIALPVLAANGTQTWRIERDISTGICSIFVDGVSMGGLPCATTAVGEYGIRMTSTTGFVSCNSYIDDVVIQVLP